MNEQLPPIDSGIRDQLTRRAGGRLPDGLFADVSAALNAVATERPRRLRPAAPVAWRSPRFAAAAAIALIAVLGAALIAVPRFQTTPGLPPAGYPTNRALTTDELARLMAGPPLTTNTTLVASVTIEARTDVCPMNSRPTIGVVEGMGSQVCVMGSSVSEYLKQAAGTGTFAFRYMAPGYLGLIGEITPASSRLAFRVSDEWPLAGQTLLVEGYLGATALHCGATETPDFGDILNPSGYEPCQLSWLSEDGSPAPVIENQAAGSPAESGGSATSPAPSIDLLALHGKARYVMAGGARQLDSIPLETTRGIYVVRVTTGPCPGASPVDSRGCAAWQVLAKVADVSVPKPTAVPTAKVTATPIAGYPANRALTTAELAQLLAGPALPTNTAIVASVTIQSRTDVCPMNRYPTVGVVEGMGSQVCVMGATLAAQLSGPTVQGIFAFRYLAPGYLGLLGEIAPAADSKVAFRVADNWPPGGQTFLVDGWLGAYPISCPTYIATSGGDPLDPDGQDQCAFNWLTDDPSAEPLTSANRLLPPGGGRFVEAGGMRLIDAIPGDAPVHGVYVVRNMGQSWRVLAKLANVSLLAPTATTASPIATPTPTAAPPATPIAMPTGPSGAASVGLFGSGNRPLTVAEFPTLWAADPAHLAGRIAIVKGPVPTGFECWSAGAADAVPSPGCHIAILDGQIAPEGYWAIRIGADGKLAIVGELSTPTSSFVFSPDEVNAATSLKDGDLVVVEGWLLEYLVTCDFGATPLPSGCGPYSAIESTASDNSPASVYVQQGAYEEIIGTAGDWTTEGPPVHGLFLVRLINLNGGTLVARLEAVPAP